MFLKFSQKYLIVKLKLDSGTISKLYMIKKLIADDLEILRVTPNFLLPDGTKIWAILFYQEKN